MAPGGFNLEELPGHLVLELPELSELLPLLENGSGSGWGSGWDYNGSEPCCAAAPCAPGAARALERRLLPALYGAAFALGLAGNSAVLAVLLRARRHLSATDVFALNLAAADALLVLTLPFWAVQAARGWVFGAAACRLLGPLLRLNFYAGLFLLAGIAAERRRALCRAAAAPPPAAGPRRRRRATAACAAAWAAALALAAPEALALEARGDARAGAVLCARGRRWRAPLAAAQLALGFAAPLAALLAGYGGVARALLRARGGPRRGRAARLVGCVLGAFALCWAPLHGALLAAALRDAGLLPRDCAAEERLAAATAAATALGYFHCCLNPLLYGFVGVRFRRRLREMLRGAAPGAGSGSARRRGGGSGSGGPARSDSTEATYTGL
ncbi:C-X-C chemokine receptor type 3-like [Apteryx mantelli]|uniref:C-X-C chemokine receptor type 3-like n=1 Tax=Apteryx mantelli TaxID=2696672 RepID=A0ABM4G6X9_9AVES